VLSFAEAKTLDPPRRRAVALDRLDRLEPTWAATNLGQALVDTVAAIEDVADASEKTGRMPRRIVLISDLQQGSRLDALGELEWPSDVELDLKPVSGGGSNAGLHRLTDPTADPGAPPGSRGRGTGSPPGSQDSTGKTPVPQGVDRRVRVFNDADSSRDKFALRWTGSDGSGLGESIGVYVPPGESRVVRVPPPPGAATPHALVLEGDTDSFDNTLYVADERKAELTVLYVGTDKPGDTGGLLYYLMRVFPGTARRSIQILAQPPSAALGWESDRSLPLIILAAETGRENTSRLQKYLRGGGTVVFVMTPPARGETLAALADVPPPAVAEAAIRRDVMLGEIAFDHPLFAPMAGAQYSDFTKIHFWKYRRLDEAALGEARVLARFENRDIAVLEKTLGRGNLVVLASGWNPDDSQLARSSKFVPLMTALLDRRDPGSLDSGNHTVGDRVLLPARDDDAKALVVHKPSGAIVALAPGTTSFSQTHEPGVYTIDTPAGARSFAVNLDPAESKTAPLHVETLEQFGCKLVNATRKPVDREQLRQLQNAELESRQKLWRWLILAAIGVLVVETWLAGRITRPRLAHAEALST
jgi:hypothetical protein